MQLSWPDGVARFWIDHIALPVAITDFGKPMGASRDGLQPGAMLIEGATIARIVAGMAPRDGAARIDAGGAMVLPRFVDIHTHLDKGHVFHRAPNPDGTFLGARETVGADREANWSAADVETRMDFALRAAFHHGTGAIRTHLDSIGKQTAISWPVFDQLRTAWKGRIALEAVSLFPVTNVIDDPADFSNVVRHVTRYGGILGAVTFLGQKPDGKLDAALDRIVTIAKAEGLGLDFHVDESASPDARTLERIADAIHRHQFKGKVLVGHCCSLALMEEEDRKRVIDKLGASGMALVSLPMCNLYLQDRQSGITPRWRGVAPVHELDAAGIPAMIASDNTRDPFYAYGDLDCVEVFREGTRILHLDHSERPWITTVTSRPAGIMGLKDHGRLRPGMAADFVVFSARTMNEFLSRPQSDRMVVLAGRPVAAPLPDYAELDGLS